ncbi:MAG: SDR family oxidoreductase [Candidatus Eremiobacteraeota bacterium]|nr:SDR family oxidoreductase [Candidatus Eremiobacteraeota bacterium]MCW5868453.1 SDR family oxidoreductase [Candidatus Eremiobacteraeota bacterium]
MKPLAVITGGTSGIGLATAWRLRDRYRLALTYAHDSERAAAAEARLGPESRAFAFDVGSDAEVQAGYRNLKNHFGAEPEVLVNCAGVKGMQRFFLQGCTLKGCQELMNLHYFGTLRMVKQVLPGMYSRRRGSIVNLSSVSACGGYRGLIGYSEAKAAVECFTKNLAVEVAHRGLTVSCVRPALVETALTAEMAVRLDPTSLNQPLGRWIQSDEVAQAIAFLLESGGVVNGQIVTLDGANLVMKVPLR